MDLAEHEVHLWPSCTAFKAMQASSIKLLASLKEEELRPILPSLVRTALCAPLDLSEHFRCFRKEVQKKISEFEAVNSIVPLLTVDFNVVHEDAIKEQQLRQKTGRSRLHDNVLGGSLQRGLLMELEEGDPIKRMRLVLGELLRLIHEVSMNKNTLNLDNSELFQAAVYINELSDVLCIAFAETPSLLPIRELSEALLQVKYGPLLLCRLVANCPDCFDVVCTSILSNSKTSDEADAETIIRTKTLKMLCGMNPSYKKVLRAECVSMSKLTGFAIELSLSQVDSDNRSDIVPFFTGMLLASDSKTKDWITDFMKAAQKDHRDNSTLSLFKKQMIKEMEMVVASFMSVDENEQGMDVDAAESNNSHLMHGIAIMRLYCSLKSILSFKFTTEESEILLSLIVCHPPVSPVGVRFAVVGLCTMVACAFIMSTQEREDKVINWLQWLTKVSPTFEKHPDIHSSFGETLLLIAIHFHGHSLEPIIELVCSTLGIKLRPSSLTKLKILFTQQVFPEKVVAEHALTVPVTSKLCNNMKGFLPLHCIHQLFKSRVFTKHSISVKEWIFNQICSCRAPVHTLMIPLIDTFVRSIIVPINISKSAKLPNMCALLPFSEERLLSVFLDKSDEEVSCRTTSQLLMMLYALIFQDYLLSSMKDLITKTNRPKEYSAKLYATIPMKQLLLKARQNKAAYGDLYPPLLRLLVTHYPHLCLVEDWIEEEELTDNTLPHVSSKSLAIRGRSTDKNDEICTPEQLKEKLENVEMYGAELLMQLSKLTVMPANKLTAYADAVVGSLPLLLDQGVPRKILMLCSKIWMKLNSIIPRQLWLKTVNALRERDKGRSIYSNTTSYTSEEIERDPLIVLRCDRRVYRCPPIFDLLVRVLNAYLAASRALLNHHLLSNPLAAGNKPTQMIAAGEQEREELKIALIATQESAAAQILLEVCLPTEFERKSPTLASKWTLQEIRCRVCCYLHQAFITEPKMAKLVHFQGYPPELLAVTATGVPSMHICIDFIPELLNQPQLEKQLFAVQLLSRLALQYPMPKSMTMAKYIVGRLDLLLFSLPAPKRNRFFVPVMPCMVQLCKAFPPLRVECTELLIKLGRIAYSQINKNPLSACPQVKTEEDDEDDESSDEFMEIDVKGTSHVNSGESNVVRTTEALDGDNPAYCREPYMKKRSSQELLVEAEKTFKEVTNLSLYDKLAVEHSNS